MVWAGVCALGKTPLVFIPQGVKINSEVYQSVVLTKLHKWARKQFGRLHWIFQQDGAPAHFSKSTLEFLKEKSGIRNFW
jgi:hypothetical protein